MTKYLYLFSLLTCFLAGYFVYSFIHKPETVESVETRISIVRDTIIPPPITRWMKGETKYDTISRIDTVTKLMSLDTLAVRTFTDTLVRGNDSVGVVVQVFPGMDLKARIMGQFNPDWVVTRETIRTVEKHSLVEWGFGATGGIDVRGKPNIVGGITLKIHLDKLNPWRR